MLELEPSTSTSARASARASTSDRASARASTRARASARGSGDILMWWQWASQMMPDVVAGGKSND